jgi:hypothetical protein
MVQRRLKIDVVRFLNPQGDEPPQPSGIFHESAKLPGRKAHVVLDERDTTPQV